MNIPNEPRDNYWASEDELPATIKASNYLRDFIDRVGRFGSWFILPVIFITCYDVLLRKFKFVYVWILDNFGRPWFFQSTILQELEWHMHTALFALVLGYGYIHNTHVRVDLVRERLSFRRKAWLEFLGVTVFLIPYLIIVIGFAYIYAYDSFMRGEMSASAVGLSHRWIIKSVLFLGLVAALIAGIGVWLQTVAVLWGNKRNLRYPLMTLEWPEFEGLITEGKQRLVLDEQGNVVVDPTADPEDLELPPEVLGSPHAKGEN